MSSSDNLLLYAVLITVVFLLIFLVYKNRNRIYRNFAKWMIAAIIIGFAIGIFISWYTFVYKGGN